MWQWALGSQCAGCEKISLAGGRAKGLGDPTASCCSVAALPAALCIEEAGGELPPPPAKGRPCFPSALRARGTVMVLLSGSWTRSCWALAGDWWAFCAVGKGLPWPGASSGPTP